MASHIERLSDVGTAARVEGRVRALMGLSLGYFMVLLDTTVLSVAEPDIASSLHASIGGLQWVVDSYTITLAAFLLSAGAVADRIGPARMFRFGVAAFGTLSLLTTFAPSVGALIALRALLGVVAAACIPSSTAMIAQLYPQQRTRARALAVWTAISGVGLASGPLVGGVLVGVAGWRAVFVINAPVAIVVLLLVAHRGFASARARRPINVAAQLLACASLASLSGALIALGGGRASVAAPLLVAAVCCVGTLVAVERRSAHPVFVPAILRARGVGAGLLAGGVVNFALTGVIFAIPLVLAAQFRLAPMSIGLFLLALTIPCALNPLLTGYLVARHGSRPPIVGGLALVAVGPLLLGFCIAAGLPLVVFALGLAVTGFGISFALPALVSAVLGAVPADTAGNASGLLNAVRQMGATMGVAVMGATLATPPLAVGGASAIFIAAALAAVGCIVYAVLTRPK
ncbi:MFS transporter [Leifsonia sp. NPDC102414]|uniref:MFS transporter n=1 Tax=Leifsonia sp. NPDC102414 TaxID=3364124 RepID=UPI003808C0D6